jgi:hypothetical protein
MAPLIFTHFVLTCLVVHCKADPKEAVLSLVERMDALYQKSRAGTEERNAQAKAMGNLRELARAAVTPGVKEVFSSTVDKLSTDVETNIKEGHSKTQIAINNAVNALESATTNALALKQTADATDQSSFNCVRVEKSLLESVEHADKALAKSRSAVTEPCQEQEDKASFNWEAKEEDVAFVCDVSIHDNCDSQLASYKSQLQTLFQELQQDVKEAGSEYAEAKLRCEKAREDVVRKQSALDGAKLRWQEQQTKCQDTHKQRGDTMCTFGSALQNKCSDAADYTSLVAEINTGNGNHSHRDRVEEWKVMHASRCWLSKAATGEKLDDAALTGCVNSVNFEKDVGTLDLKSKTVSSLTSPSCSEQTVTFDGKQWKIPTGSNAKSTDYSIEDFTPAVSLTKDTPAFSFCAA